MRIRLGLRLTCLMLLTTAPVVAQDYGASGDVPYAPTPPEVIDAMMELGRVDSTDLIYDLGCGDGRIVIAAARDRGARGVGYDINPERIEEATANAKEAGVQDRVRFVEGNLFDADIGEATVVVLYLLTSVNLELRPKLWQDLKPGTRVVSHLFDMGDWEPDKEVNIRGRRVFVWTIPEDAAERAEAELSAAQ